MYSAFRCQLARFLCKYGVSQRSVSRLLRIDRGTVARAVSREWLLGRRLVIVRRCPRCGAYVQWPCRVCRLRKGTEKCG